VNLVADAHFLDDREAAFVLLDVDAQRRRSFGSLRNLGDVGRLGRR
jgi:hypothetical protein